MPLSASTFRRTTLLLLWVVAPALQGGDIAIVNVSVVDVTDGSIRAGQTVLIEGNRIGTVASSDEVPIPDGADTVEGQERYLIPGLWDMHVHSLASVAADVTMDKSSGSIAAQDWHFPLFLAHGVTGIRNMNDRTGDLSLALTKEIRHRLAEGDLLGPPRFLSAGPSIDGDPPLGSHAVAVRDAAEARGVVRKLAANGADLVKVYENLSRDAYFAILDEARRNGIPVDGHIPFRVTPLEAARLGQRTVEHPDALAAGCSGEADAIRRRFDGMLADFENLSENEQFLIQFRLYGALYDSRNLVSCQQSIQTFLQHDVAVTADLVAYHNVVHANEVLADASVMQFVPPAVRRNWEEQASSEVFREFQAILRPLLPLELENTQLFNEAGVTLLAGTDVGVPLQVPGISLHAELQRLVEAGLSPLEAIRTATVHPAQVLGMDDDLGTVAVGKLADLILLDANPLDDITSTRKIRAVIADGRLYRRADLDKLVADVRASYAKREGEHCL